MARSKYAALLSAAVLSVIAGSAFGQAGLPTHVSGLLHVPLGDATFDPASGRRLPVRNLGSSGRTVSRSCTRPGRAGFPARSTLIA